MHLAVVALCYWLLTKAVPDTLSLHVFGRSHTIWDLHRRVVDRTLEVSLLIPSVFLVEYVWVGWKESSVRHLVWARTPSSWSDVGCYLLGAAPAAPVVSAVMSFGAVYISGGWLRHLVGTMTGVHLNVASAPLAVQVASLLVLYSFFDYWSHRLDHSRTFWPLHRFHHSAETFSVLTAARVHPAMFTAVITTMPGLLLGPSRGALIDMGLIAAILRLMIHSRIDSDFGWVGRWIVQSPLHHKQHHSFNRMAVNVGLAPIWDHLFGTWRDLPSMPLKMGTPTPYRHGLWIGPDIWRDYCEFLKGVRTHALKRRLSTR